MNKYSEAMSHVTMDEAMKNRILDGVMKKSKEKKRKKMVRIISTFSAMAAVLLLMAIAIPRTGLMQIMHPDNPDILGPAIAPEIVEFESVEELAMVSGMPITECKYLPFEPVETEYYLYDGLPLIKYYASEYEIVTYGIYEGDGAPEGIEGVFNVTKRFKVHGHKVVAKGGMKYSYLIYWEDQGFHRYIYIDEGLTKKEIKMLIE